MPVIRSPMATEPCKRCDGAGELVKFGAPPTADGDYQRVPCPDCLGTGLADPYDEPQTREDA